MEARCIVTLVLLFLAEAAEAQTDRASADEKARGAEGRANGTLALPKTLGALPHQPCDSGGLTELLKFGIFEGKGVHAQKLSSTPIGGEGVRLVEGSSFRWRKGIAVRLVLYVPADLAAWRLGRAELVTDAGPPQSVRATEALLSSPGQRVLLVTSEAGPDELQGEFMLDLHEASGGPTLTLERVSFP